jgi:ParB-like chromosome segregation protein Spo0J
MDEATAAWPADKVERRELSALLPYAQNARVHSREQINKLVESMRQFGWTVPALVDEAGVIIAGHGRVMAAAQLGLSEVPVMVARGWSDAQKRAYRIADNALTDQSVWSRDLLKIELGDLQELNVDLSLTGLDDKYIDRLLAEVSAPADFDEADENVPIQHSCPRCGYRWSGKPDAGH